jgi:hypothetical protein
VVQEGLLRHPVDQVLRLLPVEAGLAEAAVSLGADVPDLPGRPLPLHRGDHRFSGPLHPGRINGDFGRAELLEGAGEHRLQLAGAAEDLEGLGAPGGALLGEAARSVLAVTGLQGGLLGELDRFDRGGRAAVVGLKPRGELALAGLDGLPAGGPAGGQGRGDADDLPDRPFP